jgi:phage terminase Nu1 subunit (DNA packaging protein)
MRSKSPNVDQPLSKVEPKRGKGRPVTYLTETELSDTLEVEARELRKWRSEGCPHVMRSARVLYRLPQVVEWARERAVKALDADETKERARKMRADADRSEMAAAKLRAELAPVVEMDRAVERLASAVAKEVNGLRSRFTMRVIGLTTPAEAAGVLDDMARQIMRALADAAGHDDASDEMEVAA